VWARSQCQLLLTPNKSQLECKLWDQTLFFCLSSLVGNMAQIWGLNCQDLHEVIQHVWSKCNVFGGCTQQWHWQENDVCKWRSQNWLKDLTKHVILFVGNQLAFLWLVIQCVIDAFALLKNRQTKMLTGSCHVMFEASPCAFVLNARNVHAKKHFFADQCSTCWPCWPCCPCLSTQLQRLIMTQTHVQTMFFFVQKGCGEHSGWCAAGWKKGNHQFHQRLSATILLLLLHHLCHWCCHWFSWCAVGMHRKCIWASHAWRNKFNAAFLWTNDLPKCVTQIDHSAACFLIVSLLLALATQLSSAVFHCSCQWVHLGSNLQIRNGLGVANLQRCIFQIALNGR